MTKLQQNIIDSNTQSDISLSNLQTAHLNLQITCLTALMFQALRHNTIIL